MNQRQAEVLAFIQDYFEKERIPPSMRIVSEHFGWKSHNSSQHHMQMLAAEGYLKKTRKGYIPA